MDDFNEEELTEEEMANKAAAEEVPEPPEDTSENTEGEFEADTFGKTLVAVGSKSLINFLLKKYKFVIAIALGAIGLFFIILAVITGSGVPEYEYVEPNCEQVTVIYKPYGSDEERTVVMDMEEYVKKALYAYTEDLPSKSLYYLYSSLSIALRTEALNNNCRVTYRDKVLREPSAKDADIERALKNTAGVVMVDKNNDFINASVSDFCWNSQTEDNYQLYQNLAVPLEFAGANFSNEIYTFCPCNDEQGDPTDEENEYSMCWSSNEEDAEWLHQDETNGYSVYGAYYLAIGYAYLDDNILNHFFGEDIYLKTIIKSNAKKDDDTLDVNSSDCMWWPIGSDETTTENGVVLASGKPSTTAITSYFGNRGAPIAGASTYHRAIDIGNGVEGKTNIIAAASGKVIAVNTGCTAGNYSCGGQLGNYVKIEHPDGTVTRYGHMYSVTVQNGDSVVQGQVIGTMGNTGNSTGPHLDFQILVNGTAVNPLDYVSTTKPRPTGCTSHVPGYSGSGNQEFIDFIAPYAVEDMKTSNILASVTIAQAILESGWGSSGLARNYNNYFGMKAGSSWTGETVDLPTRECNSNGCYATTATWRVYSSPLESLKDHSRLLANNRRYNGVVGEKDYVTAITIIKNGGYATDPDYVNKIVAIIENNNLTQYDNG